MKVVFPGSFDPMTLGHLNIIERLSRLFEQVIVLILINSSKKPLFSIEERVDLINQTIKAQKLDNVIIDSFKGLTIEYLNQQGIPLMVRGLRSIEDLHYEERLAEVNRQISQGKIETLFMFADPRYRFVSSSIIKDLAIYGKRDILQNYIPPAFIQPLLQKFP